MILPIVAFGHPVLRQKTEKIDREYPDLEVLIENMFETMYHASGVGLAAPQIGLSIRLFIVDGAPMIDRAANEPELKTFQQVFINPEVIEEDGKPWAFEEGCLSIPGLRENVNRKPLITVRYWDREWNERTELLDGLRARIVQHEHDHLEGVLFTDYSSPLKKQLNNGKLQRISRGDIVEDYPMTYHRTPKQKA